MALPDYSMSELLEAGAHFGHQKHRWNPKMEPFIFGVRNNIHILDLSQTIPLLHRALTAVRDVTKSGGRILFVGTKRQGQEIIANAANDCAQYYMNHRWYGGTLTNWKTISNTIKRLRTIEDLLDNDDLSGLTKKELLKLNREKDILNGWTKLSVYAKKIGLKYLLWEPISIKRELGDTIKYTKYLHKKLNINSQLPILLNLDVDHGNHFSKDKRDGNPYEWLNELSHLSPSIHIKQKTKDIYTHKPFIKKYNKSGIIKPDKILKSLEKSNCKNTTLYFEFSFREREPFDSQSIKDIKESVKLWRQYVKK